ncbi:MAG TPA: 6-phosphogluconolactonase [Pseudomonas xinjiangensis]|uniref:6-phosphogluconolactonase n=2 Tax=root TaxID=1 RepID=A0A7V1FT74_9GAMM|nr:6-phosphogluconolactonase [Halopseudomonas xinjiangensis]HEC48246.1 6-phosphogluconolactonase [Halopseudomonas xinjiangensis]
MTLEQCSRARGLPFDAAATAEAHAEHMASRVLEGLRQAIQANGTATLALSGGRGPEQFLRRLDAMALEWEKVTVTLVDERWVPEDHPDSNAGMIKRCLPRALQRAQWIPMYQGESPEQDAARMEVVLRRLLPADVLVLGMGPDGHTASLFPQTSDIAENLSDRARQLCQAVPAAEGRRARLTMTGKAIRQAKLLLLQISGEQKYRTLLEAFEAEPEKLPVAAFLAPPMEIFYSPEG